MKSKLPLPPTFKRAISLVSAMTCCIALAAPGQAQAAPQDLEYGTDWNTIGELLRTASNYDFASGQKMTIKGNICGNVANPSNPPGNYKNTGTVGGAEDAGANGPLHSMFTSQKFDCQWYTTASGTPPNCASNTKNKPSDQLFVDIAVASNTAKNLSSPTAATQFFAGIDTNGADVTINVVSGLNVINIPEDPVNGVNGKLQVRGAGDLIINGPADATVIVNVGSDNQINKVSGGMTVNGSSILLNGGVLAENVLFNVLAGDVTASGVSSPEVINGTILVRAGSDVKGKFTGQGTLTVNGAVLGDGNHSSEFLINENVTICR